MLIGRLILLTLSVSFYGTALSQVDNRQWKPLRDDGLHDPQSPAIGVLQEPGEALRPLPPDYAGNQVLWVDALREGYIEPRSNLFPDTTVDFLDMDIVMEHTSIMPMVLFPHAQHTEWLDCKNCHDIIFKEKVGANQINMFQILQGEYCGRCHGAVAFPLTECFRCHSVPRDTFTGEYGVQPKTSTDADSR